VVEIFGTDNKVVLESIWTIGDHTVTGETVELDTPLEVISISVFTIECGEIVSLNTLVDELALLVGLSVYEPLPTMEATPAA